LTQSNPAFDLHQRVLTDLQRRDTAVREQESEARRLLEQALAQCAAERAAIANERAVLAQAEQLYAGFFGRAPSSARTGRGWVRGRAPGAGRAADGRVHSEETQSGGLELEDFDPASGIDARVRDLRNGLAVQVTKEDAVGQKPTQWTGPLRALLSSSS
jgi:hypothetical protein